MGKRFLRFFGFLLFLSLLIGPTILSAPPDQVLTILHSSDTHSALIPFGPQDKLGGIARMSTLIKTLRAKNENVLAFHSGDAFVGSFEFNKYLGYPELKIMEGLYDGMELGNHEFDLGLDVLTGVLTGAIPGKDPLELPVLCANIDETKLETDPIYQPYGPVLASILEPWMVEEISGIKVGIFGLVNTDPQNYSQLALDVLTDPIDAAFDQVTELRTNEACDIVICLSHLGTMYDESALGAVPGIDIILGGHSHDLFEEPYITPSGAILVEGGEYGLFLGELKVRLNSGDGNGTSGVEAVGYEVHKVDWRVRKDPRLLRTLSRLQVGIVQDPRFGPVYTRHVAQALWDIEGDWDPNLQYRDTALGNFVTDAVRAGLKNEGFEVDAALEAQGYIAHKIYKGKVVGNDIMRVVPYGYDQATGLGFKVVIAELNIYQLAAGLEYSVQYIPYAYDMLIQASGLTYNFNSNIDPNPGLYPPWRVDSGSILINGLAPNPDPNFKYKIALSEQVFGVLQGLDPTITATETGLFVYDLVRDYARQMNHLDATSEGRILDTAN
jgi:2',3'-cyclic-nucleotide 2'-phosphodiesterase (5'-nucleotidase family)